ncbi:hypothetical protein MUG91_G1932n2 [Manis pentadactyla]|nr:hypothetical protein MUG91_G1932n1 [Manis pentadactyla]KAI5248809.1 hypothetical protein MUG91_G1932n2 [Manis pentadactyla]
MVAETLALRKELGSGSDVTGSARYWIRVMGECAIQFQDYSEAIVVSMVILQFQATDLASCLWYGMTDIDADGIGSGDINADAEDPA